MAAAQSEWDEMQAVIKKYSDTPDSPRTKRETDRFGFVISNENPQESPADREKNDKKELTEIDKWLNIVGDWEKRKNDPKLLDLIYQGIPHPLRGIVWGLLLDVPRSKMNMFGVYNVIKGKLKDKGDPMSILQVDKDIPRTFTQHDYFMDEMSPKQKELFWACSSLSLYHPIVGYVQGLNFLMGLFLMVMPEEDAFWAVSNLLTNDRHGLMGFFQEGFPKMKAFRECHDEAIKRIFPKVWTHLDKNSLMPEIHTTRWYMTCFINQLPFHLVLRLWDVILIEGNDSLAGMTFALFDRFQKEILKLDIGDLFGFFGNLNTNPGLNADSDVKLILRIRDGIKKVVQERNKLKGGKCGPKRNSQNLKDSKSSSAKVAA